VASKTLLKEKEYAQSRPGKRGFPLNISARIHPTDPSGHRSRGHQFMSLRGRSAEGDSQTSIAKVYSLKVSMISGARYHLVATYLQINLNLSVPFVQEGT